MGAKIAFATSSEFPNLTDDDRLAAQALAAHGLTVDPVLWDSPRLEWTSYAAVIIRSCWDYHYRPADFKAWLDRLDDLGVSLWNPAELVRWNMDKTYLSDLQQQGVRVLPSVWLARGARVQLAHLMAEKGWEQVVVKPLISAGAKQTVLISRGDAPARQAEFAESLQQSSLIVQEFASEVQARGEWSFLFFGGQYSHAVLKQPHVEDFRVQDHFGGTVQAASPSAALIDQAGEILALLDADLLYARVDAIERNGSLYLMELELIEPCLYFEFHPQAPLRFADALLNHLAVKE